MRPSENILFPIFLFLGIYACSSQSFNLDNIGKADLISLSGGLAANTVFYQGSSGRRPFTYFLQGNTNINISGLYNIPLSFMYSNQQFDVPSPFQFNRLSLHPSYKWVRTHIGDVAMNFSPYTLNGHQFRGFGVDLTPNGPLTISAMYGRLLKAAEYNASYPEVLPAYKRMGYGLKTTYDFDKITVGLIVFSARDQANSIENLIPAALNVSPKSNVVLSGETSFRLFDKAEFTLEYATTAITEDIRVKSDTDRQRFLGVLGNENITTRYHNAFKAVLSYPVGSGSLGAAYERVDPGYRTFGAYFFNNDLENITVNASQQLFSNKLSLHFNAGLQRDDLDGTKTAKLQRMVTSLNLNYTPSDRLSFTGAYSNFQSYTNIRNQFDYINEVSPFDNLDTLNYRQISQSANLGVHYQLKKTKDRQHSLNVNLALQNAENSQGDRTLEESSSVFYNSSAAYTLGYPERDVNISVALNATQNTLADHNTFTLGPTLSINKQFLEKKLRSGFSGSYNTSFVGGVQQAKVYNFRAHGSYSLKKAHQLQLNMLCLLRNTAITNANDLTVTFGYRYSFGAIKLKLKKEEKTSSELLNTVENHAEMHVQFRYRGVIYKGTLTQVSRQLHGLEESETFKRLTPSRKTVLTDLLEAVDMQTQANHYKEKALYFLAAFYAWKDSDYKKALQPPNGNRIKKQ